LAPPCSLGAPCPRHPTSAFFQCLRSRSPDRPILLHLGALRGLPGQSSCPELAPCERATVSGLGGGTADLGRAGRELLASIRVVAVPCPLRGAFLIVVNAYSRPGRSGRPLSCRGIAARICGTGAAVDVTLRSNTEQLE